MIKNCGTEKTKDSGFAQTMGVRHITDKGTA